MWVLAVARNAVIDHYRARTVRDHADIDDAGEVAAMGDDEERRAVRDLTPCLMRMVKQLPEPYREAVKLADFEGLSQQEIADRTGISLSGPSRGCSGPGSSWRGDDPRLLHASARLPGQRDGL